MENKVQKKKTLKYPKKKDSKDHPKPIIQKTQQRTKGRSKKVSNKASLFIFFFFLEPWGLSAPPKGGESPGD